MPRRHMQRRQRGFTILELMVALVAGLITILTAYTLSAASSRHFQTQQRVGQTQMAIRTAVEQMRRDIQLAGFGGSSNTLQENLCFPSAFDFGAVEYEDDADTAALPNAAENDVEADRLRLIGNYASSDRYFTQTAPAGDLSVRLQPNWQGFQRSFGAAATFSEDAFNDVFRAGRWVHVEDKTGCHFFAQITGTNASNAEVIFNHAAFEIKRGAILTPLMRIEYLVVDAGDPSVGALFQGATDDRRGITNSVLIRREVAFDNAATPINNSERVVLEYAADVNYRFVVDTAALGAPPDLESLGSAADVVEGLAEDVVGNVLELPGDGGSPETVRSVILDLAVRTAEQDKNFPEEAGYRIGDTRGAARMRRARSEIFLPNVRRLQ